MNTSRKSLLLALLTCALWGSLFPCIKLGYAALAIAPQDIPSIILFAGLRFLVCGLLLTTGIAVRAKKISLPSADCGKYIVLTGTLSVVLHYALTYIALSSIEGGKASILKQVGFLLLPCIAFLFRRDDCFSVYKVLGACLGFAAVIVINLDGLQFTFRLGDLLCLCASFCISASTVIAKKAYERYSPAYVLAHGQLFGGMILTLCGLLLGGRFSHFDLNGALVLIYICVASIASYLLWETLLKHSTMSRLSIIKSTEPIFAVIFSGLLLDENVLKPSTLIAIVLVGIAVLFGCVPNQKPPQTT